MNTPSKTGAFWIVLGICLVFIALYTENRIASHHPNLFIFTVVKALDVVGIAVFAIGFLNILIETKDWREYFGERLREVVLQQTYLRTLDREALATLQTNVLKAQFKSPDIDREGGFLNYLNANLHHLVAAPYREDVTVELIYSEHDADHWAVFDKVTYTCRRGTSGIQSAATSLSTLMNILQETL